MRTIITLIILIIIVAAGFGVYKALRNNGGTNGLSSATSTSATSTFSSLFSSSTKSTSTASSNINAPRAGGTATPTSKPPAPKTPTPKPTATTRTTPRPSPNTQANTTPNTQANTSPNTNVTAMPGTTMYGGGGTKGLVDGWVTFSPTCAVNYPPANPNCAAPVSTTLDIRYRDSHTLVANVTSDTNGRFDVVLSPGIYEFYGTDRSCTVETVEVKADAVTSPHVTCR